MSFAGRVLCSPQLEIAPLETGYEAFVTVPGSSLAAVGLDGPDLVLVLAERWQIAQKLHTVTEQFPDHRENPRFRDLIDLQLLEALAPDPVLVREACERVFAARAQHPWPPVLAVQPSWNAGYAALAALLEFEVADVDQAARVVQSYIARIATAVR